MIVLVCNLGEEATRYTVEDLFALDRRDYPVRMHVVTQLEQVAHLHIVGLLKVSQEELKGDTYRRVMQKISGQAANRDTVTKPNRKEPS